MHRTWGGVIAGGLFVLPSLFILIGLSWVYIEFGNVPVVAGIFYGIKPAVTAIVVHAAHRIGSRALKNGWLWAIAAASFVAIFALNVPFPLIVLAAAVLGYIGGKVLPDKFVTAGKHGSGKASYGPALIDDDTATRACPFPLELSAQADPDRCGAMDAPHGVADRHLRLARHSDPDGLVLHQGCVAHLRRCLRGVALCLPRCGRSLRLAVAADDRRPGPGGNNAGAVDHGGDFRRLHRRLHPPDVRHRPSVPGGRGGGCAGHLVHLPALVPVHPPAVRWWSRRTTN
jgi:hypothetical protein